MTGATDPPAWMSGAAYAYLRPMQRSAFAWEWLRRSAAYRRAWLESDQAKRDPRPFGLVAFENPALGADVARPLWSAAIDPAVLFARIADGAAPRGDSIDLLRVRSFVAAIVDTADVEHLLFSDGDHDLRIDVAGGTLIGSPAMLAYRLAGLDRVRAPLGSLNRLVALMATGRFARSLYPPEARAARWILELRVADALDAGASQQQIARVLFARTVEASHWRAASPAVRSRVQRIVRAARQRRNATSAEQWFAR